VKDTCDHSFTYDLDGNTATFLGVGDFHDPAHDSTERVIPFYDYEFAQTQHISGHCQYSLHVYASSELIEDYQSNIPLILTIVVASTFLFMATTFGMVRISGAVLLFWVDWFCCQHWPKSRSMSREPIVSCPNIVFARFSLC
jgi:hypothetical protein